VVDPRQLRAEHLAVGRDAAYGNTAETDTMIATRPPDEPRARTFAAQPVVGERHLQCRVDSLRTRVDEEGVIDPFGAYFAQSVRQFKHFRMTKLERHGVVERLRLLLDRLHDLRVTVPGIAAPEARHCIQELLPIVRKAVHPFGT